MHSEPVDCIRLLPTERQAAIRAPYRLLAAGQSRSQRSPVGGLVELFARRRNGNHLLQLLGLADRLVVPPLKGRGRLTLTKQRSIRGLLAPL